MKENTWDTTRTKTINEVWTTSNICPESIFDNELSSAFAQNSPTYLLVVLLNKEPENLDGYIYGLVVKPTGSKPGQFTRLGSTGKQRVKNIEEFLRKAKDPANLNEQLYQAADLAKGFTIEII